jgi:Protein of unknown function (DUF2950)
LGKASWLSIFFYEKDFGSKTLAEFREMELFNPDKSWTLVPAQDE